jgi:glycosyltransferase involved in cell wall biosynthesis
MTHTQASIAQTTAGRHTTLPSISLVTCSYQQARFLEATLQSVISQQYRALEYRVIDGNSTDGSVEILQRYQRELTGWVSEPDAGQTDALIKGFAQSSGEIMGWLCSDDLLLPGALHAVGRYFAAHPQVLAVYGDALWIDEHGGLLRPKKEIPFNRFIFLYDHNYVPQPSMFWRRSLYDAVGGLNPRFNLAMDGDLWARFSEHGRIGHLDQYLSCMRFYDSQKTRALRPNAQAENASLRARYSSVTSRHFDPLLHAFAKALRACIKIYRGGYGARVPQEHLQWLRNGALAEPSMTRSLPRECI